MTTKPAPSPQFLAEAEALGLTPEQYAVVCAAVLADMLRDLGTRPAATAA